MKWGLLNYLGEEAIMAFRWLCNHFSNWFLPSDRTLYSKLCEWRRLKIKQTNIELVKWKFNLYTNEIFPHHPSGVIMVTWIVVYT